MNYSEIKEKELDSSPFIVSWADAYSLFTATKKALFIEPNPEGIEKAFSVDKGSDQDREKYKDKKEQIENALRFETKIETFIYEEYNDFIMAGKYLASLKSDSYLELDKEYAIKHYKIPPSLLEYCKGNKVSLAASSTDQLVLKINDNNNLAYIVLFETPVYEKNLTVHLNGELVTASAWDDKTRSYKTLIKKGHKMAKKVLDFDKLMKLPDLDSAVKSAKEAADKELEKLEDATNAEVIEKIVKNEKKVVESADEKTVEDINLEQVVEVSEYTEDEAEVNDEVGVAESETTEDKKVRRKRAPKTKVTDLQEIIDVIAGSVDKEVAIDEAVNEIRQLRDLSLVATRRISNLSLTIINRFKNDITKLEQLKSLLQ